MGSRADGSLLLAYQPAPVDRKQAALTARFITPVLGDLHDLLMEVRTSIDAELSSTYPTYNGNPYPLGRCSEISKAVRSALMQRIAAPKCRAERALNAFGRQGGLIRPVWGALRDRYFQNATQIGALYTDVANDTVNVTKPKVEIMPMAESGLVAIRDIRHFRDIACQYWQADIHVNLAAPSLAPLLPMIGANPTSALRLLSACDYMLALVMRDRFRDAEDWLATGPALAPERMADLLARMPVDLRPPTGADARALAVAACRQARQERRYLEPNWLRDRLRDLLRIDPELGQAPL